MAEGRAKSYKLSSDFYVSMYAHTNKQMYNKIVFKRKKAGRDP